MLRETFKKSTLRLGVFNMPFMLERQAADCAPDQFLRELTHNAAEAVSITGG